MREGHEIRVLSLLIHTAVDNGFNKNKGKLPYLSQLYELLAQTCSQTLECPNEGEWIETSDLELRIWLFPRNHHCVSLAAARAWNWLRGIQGKGKLVRQKGFLLLVC